MEHLKEQCKALIENYIDIRNFGWNVFRLEMEKKFRRQLSDDEVETLMRQYIRRFWMLVDAGKLPSDMNNIGAWTNRIRANPTFMREWIRFIDANSS